MSISDHVMRQHDTYTHDDFVRMDERAKETGNGLRMIFDAEIERQITEPHTRERGRAEPLVWLIWEHGEDEDYTHIPSLKIICSNEYSVRYHTAMLLEQYQSSLSYVRANTEHGIMQHRNRFHIERTLLDHFFGSEMLAQAQSAMMFSKPIVVGTSKRFWNGYKRDGD